MEKLRLHLTLSLEFVAEMGKRHIWETKLGKDPVICGHCQFSAYSEQDWYDLSKALHYK